MKYIKIGAALFAGAVFILLTLLLGNRLCDVAMEQTAFEKIARQVHQIQEQEAQELGRADGTDNLGEKGEAAEKTLLPEYEALAKENPDLVGWVRIEGTRIDYPVMAVQEEPEYYLHRDFYGGDSFSGTPFIGNGALYPRSRNVIVYGHHMKNGGMFADLLKYQNKEQWERYPVICFDTLYSHQRYEIFAAFFTTDGEYEAGDFRFYGFINEGEEEYGNYIREIKERTLYETGVTPARESLLLLVTCSYSEEDERFVVAGVLK